MILKETQRTRLFKIYKPFGFISQISSNSPKQLRTKRFLGQLDNIPEGTMPVGRLDEKSEGLLLLTNDGRLSNTINKGGAEKEYYAQLDGVISDKSLKQIEDGVQIGLQGKKYQTKPCKVKRLVASPVVPAPDSSLRLGRHRPNSWVSITIQEGKFRQVRKMTAAVGYPTMRLIRVRIGSIRLQSMQPAEIEEIKAVDYNDLFGL